ncbi:hypothetical protein UFOVP184_39 [uncultured Caudovirales phage]|uniref:Uncharacterized protein n=1 Tax=uncultured Caudovirales phage TaxID=2100421 RepID=A0A6J7WCK8_9CAUD|nr:hypothetical protein UFOVP184_39 [uncultured Caudovirales phage]
MAVILLKRSATASSVPATGNMTVGELAINTADGKLFMKKGDNTVVDITGGTSLIAKSMSYAMLWGR